MSARWASFLLWALVAASAVAWGFKLLVAPPPLPPNARMADATQALRGDLARVLGADPAPAPKGDEPAPVAADPRFQLVGVVAARSANPAASAREGVALIAVDGKPPRAYRVGARIDEDVVLKAVRARGADLGPRDGAPTIALEIAPPAAAATGTLPAVGGAPTAPVAPLAAPPGRAGRPGAPGQTVPPAVPVIPSQLPNLQRQEPGEAGAPGLPQGVVTPEAVMRS